MLHPDILLQVIKQRQGELWEEAAHAARVRQLKAARKQPSHDPSCASAAPTPVYDRWDAALQELSPSRPNRHYDKVA
jgi:hypothetical protein